MDVKIIPEFRSVHIGPLDKTVILISGRAGSGKTTAAKHLAEMYDADIISFASVIKDIAVSMGWNGKKTPASRKFLQQFGTECARNILGEDIWINLWFKKARASERHVIISDDARFENELSVVKLYADTISVQIIGRCDDYTDSKHESEKMLDPKLFDYVIPNVSDMTSFTKTLDEVSSKWLI